MWVNKTDEGTLETRRTCDGGHDHRTWNASKHDDGRTEEGLRVPGGHTPLIPPSRLSTTETNKWEFPILVLPFLHKHQQTHLCLACGRSSIRDSGIDLRVGGYTRITLANMDYLDRRRGVCLYRPPPALSG